MRTHCDIVGPVVSDRLTFCSIPVSSTMHAAAGMNTRQTVDPFHPYSVNLIDQCGALHAFNRKLATLTKAWEVKAKLPTSSGVLLFDLALLRSRSIRHRGLPSHFFR